VWGAERRLKERTMINIGIVDDHAILRSGLRAFFSHHVDLRVVGEGGSGREAIDLVSSTPGLDVLVMDLSMPGQSGAETVAMLRMKAPGLGILILSGYPEEQCATNLLRQGASGYLNKQCEPEEIVRAIRVIAGGARYMTDSVRSLLAQQFATHPAGMPHEALSRREREVFIKLANGEHPGCIATTLSLSVKTVSTYRARLLGKLHLGSNSDLTYYALKHHLID
jgi:two-component system, NarL family, invasion response regulator UvrY